MAGDEIPRLPRHGSNSQRLRAVLAPFGGARCVAAGAGGISTGEPTTPGFRAFAAPGLIILHRHPNSIDIRKLAGRCAGGRAPARRVSTENDRMLPGRTASFISPHPTKGSQRPAVQNCTLRENISALVTSAPIVSMLDSSDAEGLRKWPKPSFTPEPSIGFESELQSRISLRTAPFSPGSRRWLRTKNQARNIAR